MHSHGFPALLAIAIVRHLLLQFPVEHHQVPRGMSGS